MEISDIKVGVQSKLKLESNIKVLESLILSSFKSIKCMYNNERETTLIHYTSINDSTPPPPKSAKLNQPVNHNQSGYVKRCKLCFLVS